MFLSTGYFSCETDLQFPITALLDNRWEHVKLKTVNNDLASNLESIKVL